MARVIRDTELTRRGERLLEEAAERSRSGARRRRASLIAGARPIVHTALAAGLSFALARHVLGHPEPFLAPIAAVIILGLTIGERRRRAVEVAFGVALGIFVADLIVLAIGTGAWQIGVVVAVAMTAALLLGGGPLLVGQAGTSAVLVAALPAPGGSLQLDRFLDALAGGAMALAVATLVLPIRPVSMVRNAAEPLLDALARVLADTAAALESRDEEQAESALLLARGLDERLRPLKLALAAARDSTRLSPRPSRARAELARWSAAARHIEYAVYNARVIARGAVRAVSLGDSTPPGVWVALGHLADAVSLLDDAVEDTGLQDDVHESALAAAAAANEVLQETGNMSAMHLVAQIRSTAVDVMRAVGYQRVEAQDEVRAV